MIVASRWRRAVGGIALVAAVGALWYVGRLELPTPKVTVLDAIDLSVPLPPAPVGPTPVVVLAAAESAAIERLRVRGASITVFESGEVLVHFPLGQLEREWRRAGTMQPTCGMGIAQSFTPDATGPLMTDADLVDLDRLSGLTRVNLAGTRVTARALLAFRRSHPAVVVEERDE
jgi:hypothetical protein